MSVIVEVFCDQVILGLIKLYFLNNDFNIYFPNIYLVTIKKLRSFTIYNCRIRYDDLC